VMDLAIALEGEDVGADAVEKVAVMADHARHAGERDERLLQREASWSAAVLCRFAIELSTAKPNPKPIARKFFNEESPFACLAWFPVNAAGLRFAADSRINFHTRLCK